MNEIQVIRKRKKIIILTEAVNIFGFMMFSKVGTIKFNEYVGNYSFYPSWNVVSIGLKTINVINKEMKRLQHKK